MVAGVEAELAGFMSTSGFMSLSEFGLEDLQATAARNIMGITKDILQTIPTYLEHKDYGGKLSC